MLKGGPLAPITAAVMREGHSIRPRARRASPAGWIPSGIFALLLAVAAPPQEASARGSIFSYTDARGVVHFTNVRKEDPRYQRIANATPRKRIRAPRRSDYDPLIDEVARANEVPPALVKAVIAAESAFNAGAISRAGAQGLMQLMPATADAMGVLDPFSAPQNVQAGTSYLRRLMDRYGDLSQALAAYNAGPTAVDKYGGIPPYRETQAYVERVLTYYRSYHGDFTR